MSDYDYQQIDDLIHSRIRLAAMAALAALGPASFSLIKEQIGATDGNLSVHLRKLEDGEYLEVDKSFIDRKPVSVYRLTSKGKAALKAYIQYLENLLPSNNSKD
ncbi:MAG: transcriptional regulator [Candidatus Marinimicrobia bacterium]|nr:transcriptional regulator [Candidatus Neomarinimicrobiota bacterium]